MQSKEGNGMLDKIWVEKTKTQSLKAQKYYLVELRSKKNLENEHKIHFGTFDGCRRDFIEPELVSGYYG